MAVGDDVEILTIRKEGIEREIFKLKRDWWVESAFCDCVFSCLLWYYFNILLHIFFKR